MAQAQRTAKCVDESFDSEVDRYLNFTVRVIDVDSLQQNMDRFVILDAREYEEYEQSHTRTVGSGKNARTETYYTTEHRTHSKYWNVEINYGMKQEEERISESFYNDIKKNWGGLPCMGKVKGRRPGFDSGDRYDYPLSNKTGYIYPAQMSVSFENRIKAAPTVFSYVEVPKEALVFDLIEKPDD